jgi:ABC-type transporter Mla subunit MlaD
MSMARELIAAVMAAERNIDEQIAKLTAYAKQNDDIMREITQALEGSSHQSASNMQQRLSQTQSEINQTVRMLEASKSKLMRVRQI